MIDSAQQAGKLIRNLRRQRELTGGELGRKVGLSQSKISKIETGFYAKLQPQEIEAILNILDAPKTIRQQIYRAMETPDPRTLVYRDYNTRYDFKLWTKLERKTTQKRTYTINLVPAFLQIAEYRQALLKAYGIPEDIRAHIMEESLVQQDFLWDKRRSYHFIMHQAALYTSPLAHAAHIVQLDRLERVIDIPNVTLGIVPFQNGLPLSENGSFALFDESHVTLTVAYGDIESTDPKDITLHVKIFEALDRLAWYGQDAKQLVSEATSFYLNK